MAKGRLVTHVDTDGIVAGVMMYAQSPRRYSEIVITDYKFIDAKKPEHKFYFRETDTVVDLPQPDIDVRFWADHHQSGMRYGEPEYPYLFDTTEPSCGGQLYRHFKDTCPKLTRFEELVIGCDMVDSAGYKKPSDVHDIDNYAVRLRLALKAVRRGYDHKYWKPIMIEKLARARDWRKVLEDPFVTSKAEYVIWKEKQYEPWADACMKVQKKVIVLDSRGAPRQAGFRNRYYPFIKNPRVPYLLTVGKAYGKLTMSMSENPFVKNNRKRKGKHNLGKLAKKYHKKGGGHHSIGVIPSVSEKQVEHVKQELLDLLNS